LASSASVYKRLIGLARPYAPRLAIGILAGFLVGGSLIGVFSYVKDVVTPFTPAPAAVEQVDPGVPSPVPELDGWQKRLVDYFGIEPTTEDGRITRGMLVITLLGVPLFFLLKAGATYINRYFMRWVGARVIRDIRDEVFANLQHQSLTFHGKCDIGSLISRCTNDIVLIEKAVSQTIADLTRCPVEVAACFGFVIWKSIDAGLTSLLPGLLILVVLVILPIVILGRLVKNITRKALKQVAGLISRMQETLTGIRVVKAFHMEETEISRFKALNRRYFKSMVRALRAELAMQPLMEVVAVIAICAGALMCYQKGVTLADLAPVVLAVVTAYRPLKQLAKVNVSIQRSSAAAERIFELMDLDTALPEASDPTAMTEFAEKIVFDRVRLQYSPEEPLVIDDMSFELERGHMIAFVGETGSGKTTVANLLARFYDPTAGAITIDGIDLRKVEIASLRRLVGVVNQETILFNDTIANNIAYGTPGASMDDVISAAKQANAHEFIMENPEGYERVVGEKGFVLSGGQCQRVAIARAILRNPPILILDEATSALDTVTERLVQEALGHLMENRTVFAIAHRLSTIKHADQIYLLDKGRIVENGTHDELYEHDGRYRHLCDIQFS